MAWRGPGAEGRPRGPGAEGRPQHQSTFLGETHAAAKARAVAGGYKPQGGSYKRAQWTARALSGRREMERAQEKEEEGGGRVGWEEQAGAHWVPR